MNLRLIVMRHAKSSWKEPGRRDHDRPLNGRGRRDAARVAPHLIAAQWVPQRILSSDARRTQETCEILLEALPGTPVEWKPDFYLAGPSPVRDALQLVSSQDRCVLVLGHNPGWEQLVHWFSHEHVTMKTSTLALLECPVDSWSDAVQRPAQWTLQELVHPSDMEPDDAE